MFTRSWASNSSPFTSRHIYTPPGQESSRIASGIVAQAADTSGAASPRTAVSGSSGSCTSPSRRKSCSSQGSNGDIYLTAPSVQSMSQVSNTDGAAASPLRHNSSDAADSEPRVTPPRLPSGHLTASDAKPSVVPSAPTHGRIGIGRLFSASSAGQFMPDAGQGDVLVPSGKQRKPLVEALRQRAAGGDAAAPALNAQPMNRTLRKNVQAVELSTAENSFAARVEPSHHTMFRMNPAAPHQMSQPGVAPAGGMASLDADTAMEADAPHTVWASVGVKGDPGLNCDSADGLMRMPPAITARAVTSPRLADAPPGTPDADPVLGRFHSHGSTVSSASGRPPLSPRSSLRPSSAYGSAAAPATCPSVPHDGLQPLGLGTAVHARPPSCDLVPMSPSPGPYATMARCQSQPAETESDRERVEGEQEGSWAQGGPWRHGSGPSEAVPPGTTAAEFYRKSNGLRSAASTESGAPLSPPALPTMESSAAALLASEAMAAALAVGGGCVPAGTQQRLLDQVDSLQAQVELRGVSTVAHPGTVVCFCTYSAHRPCLLSSLAWMRWTFDGRAWNCMSD